jgi:hypothetical protein
VNDDKLDLRQLEKDERVRRLVEALESDDGKQESGAPEAAFVPQFPASGSKNW